MLEIGQFLVFSCSSPLNQHFTVVFSTVHKVFYDNTIIDQSSRVLRIHETPNRSFTTRILPRVSKLHCKLLRPDVATIVKIRCEKAQSNNHQWIPTRSNSVMISHVQVRYFLSYEFANMRKL